MALLLARNAAFGARRATALAAGNAARWNTRQTVATGRFMSTFKYLESHEYVKFEEGNDVVTVGISDFAQTQLGDVVFVDLPAVGDSFDSGERFASVESVKAASEVYTPVSGKIVEVNDILSDSPEKVNEGAMTDAWFAKIKMTNPDELKDLMDEAAYQKHIE